MAARSTSRFKQKPAVPFGDFMIPILGVIALGIVVVGIRLLWAPVAPKPAIIAQPRSAQRDMAVQRTAANAAGDTNVAAEDGSVSRKETVRDVLIAQPVQRNSGSAAQDKRGSSVAQTPAGSSVIQSAPQKAARVEPKKTEAPREPEKKAATIRESEKKTAAVREPEKKPSTVRAAAESSAFVAQCGSYTTQQAAKSVAASLKKLGHSSVIRKAEVNGKTYFRVIVGGGADRAAADKVAAGIKAAGHPVFVRPND